jgi:IS30 family transposase
MPSNNISRSYGQGSVLERRHINSMIRNVEEYELTKSGNHSLFSTLDEFYTNKNICRQNFLKYYKRYVNANREIESLLPRKTGRKFKKELGLNPDIINKIKLIRSDGYNRFEIIDKLKKQNNIEISSTSMYRLLCRLGINQLNPIIKEEKRRIIKMSTGELGHIDIHYVASNTVKESPRAKLYLLGLIDSYSRICWIEVIDSIKAINVSFATMDIMVKLKHRYNIEFKEMMSDNGSEFASRNNPDHPFEKMLSFYNIKHIYTKPCSPKTNGKIERFWKTIEEELLSGEQFETLAELKHHILGYNIYYNEHRMHQGINNKMPVDMV